MDIIRITDDTHEVVEPAWLKRAEAVHRQLRPQLPEDYVGKMQRIFDGGGEMCVAAVGDDVVGVAVFRCFENTHAGRKFYVDDLVTDAQHRSSGVGRALIAFLARLAQDRGGTSIELDSGTRRAPLLLPRGLRDHLVLVPQGPRRVKPMYVGLLGTGTVGGGTCAVLRRNQEEIRRRAGRDIVVRMAAARDPAKARAVVGAEVALVGDPFEVVRSPHVEIVAELIGGTGVAKDLVLAAIASGKHVVTANKALLALHGNEIFAAAQRQRVMVAFEAAVAGGIPIIKALREGLTANRIEWIAGIINGTSNFILSEMREHGAGFAEVLKQAQQRGYAEADPTFDVEGIDAAHKLTILAAIGFGIPMQFASAYTEGISSLTRQDIRYAEELGYRIKLLAVARRTAAGIELRVHPTLIPARQLIANVEGVMNAIMVKGDAVGRTLYYGAGAGAEPTASAVVADLVDVTRLHTADPEYRVPHLAFQPESLSDTPILPMEAVETAYYLRLRVLDRPGVLADITRILADLGISIDAMLQKEPGVGEEQVDIIMLTHGTVERQVNAAIARIEGLPTNLAPVTRIRLEELSE